MSDHLTLVKRSRFCAPATRVTAKWRTIALQAYEDAGVSYCEDPEILADRLGLDVIPCDDDHAELLGNELYLPDLETYEEMGLLVYELVARALLVRNALTPDVQAVAGVSAELVLPRCIARSTHPGELSLLNPYVPLEFLRNVYASHRDNSGEMPAVG